MTFTHESGSPKYVVPGYFAADGNAGETSAESGTKWRAHLSPDKPGTWNYHVASTTGESARSMRTLREPLAPFDGQRAPSTSPPPTSPAATSAARAGSSYVGKHHLQFAGSKEYFLKAGADAPETFLGYADFDGTVAINPNKVPLKTWAAARPRLEEPATRPGRAARAKA